MFSTLNMKFFNSFDNIDACKCSVGVFAPVFVLAMTLCIIFF